MPDGPTASGGSTIGTNGLSGSSHGPQLNKAWNLWFDGPIEGPGDRPGVQNHIGHSDGNPITGEGSLMSRAMRNMPYLGDYWEALAYTHDSRCIDNRAVNAVTALTDVGLPGPLMALADAPFRMFGSSMFLDNKK